MSNQTLRYKVMMHLYRIINTFLMEKLESATQKDALLQNAKLVHEESVQDS